MMPEHANMLHAVGRSDTHACHSTPDDVRSAVLLVVLVCRLTCGGMLQAKLEGMVARYV